MTRRRFALHVHTKPRGPAPGIWKKLRAFNEEKLGGPANGVQIEAQVKDGDGAVVGAISAFTYWDWLYVDLLWMDEGLRGRGWGARLMRAAEREALDRGCTKAWVDTFTFQAPGFYERLGYEQFAVSPDHPLPGASRHFFWRRLARQPSRRRPARRK